MSKINKHGVNISDVSSIHKSFTKTSGIPADEITPAMAASWEKQRIEALGQEYSFLVGMLPKDIGHAGCWLSEKLRTIVDENGNRVVTEEQVRQMGEILGRMCFGKTKDCWKIANKLYSAVATAKK